MWYYLGVKLIFYHLWVIECSYKYNIIPHILCVEKNYVNYKIYDREILKNIKERTNIQRFSDRYLLKGF